MTFNPINSAPIVDRSVGADGKSAYEIAVDNGFEGTEKEWLESLVGERGPAGPAGADGKDGEQGPAGEPGADGADGKDGFPSEEEWDGLVTRVEALESDEEGTE